MPATSLTDEQWRAVLAAEMPQIPHPAAPPGEPSLVDRIGPYRGPMGLFGPMSPMINGHFEGESSPATWNTMFGGFSGGNPATAPPLPQDAAIAAQNAAPVPPPTPAGPPPPPGMAGRAAEGMGAGFRMPTPFETVLANYGDARKALGGIGQIGPIDRSLANTGLGMGIDSAQMMAAAKGAEAKLEKEGLGQIADVHTERGNFLRDEATQEGNIYQKEGDAIAKANKIHDEDLDWLHKNSRIDPYRKFTTNAGAGILALLGTGLMAAGAGLATDNSLNWTKQVDALLDKEADAQMAMVKNKQFAATEAGRNIQRILDTSKDRAEARLRFRAQHLAALGEKVEAIKNTTESKAVVERANQFIAENDRKIGQAMADLGIRREGLQSQEEQAKLSASVARRGQDVSLFSGLSGNESQMYTALQSRLAALAKPMREEQNKIDNAYNDAASAGRAFYEALRSGAAGNRLNDLAQAFVDAQQRFMAGGNGTVGARDEVRAYGFPKSFKELLGKTGRYDAEDVARNLDMLEKLRHDRVQFLHNGFYDTIMPPSNSVYHSGPPGR